MRSVKMKVLYVQAKFEPIVWTEANHAKAQEMYRKLGKLEIIPELNRKTVLKLENIYFFNLQAPKIILRNVISDKKFPTTWIEQKT